MAKLKISEYISLLQAGYTPAEIGEYEKMSATDEQPAPYPVPETPKPSATDEQPKPAEQQKPAEQPAPAVTPDAAERIEKAVADFTKALQSFNLANARQPGGSVNDPRDEATEILTKFCNM